MTVMLYWSSWSPSHTCGCQPAQVTSPRASNPVSVGAAGKGCQGVSRWGQARRAPAKVYIASQGGDDLQGPWPMVLKSHLPPNDSHEPGTVLSVCHMSSH